MFENRTKLCKTRSRKRQLHEMFEKNTEILEVLLLAGLLLSVILGLCHPWPLNSPDIRIDARRLVSDLLNPCSGRSPVTIDSHGPLAEDGKIDSFFKNKWQMFI